MGFKGSEVQILSSRPESLIILIGYRPRKMGIRDNLNPIFYFSRVPISYGGYSPKPVFYCWFLLAGLLAGFLAADFAANSLISVGIIIILVGIDPTINSTGNCLVFLIFSKTIPQRKVSCPKIFFWLFVGGGVGCTVWRRMW